MRRSFGVAPARTFMAIFGSSHSRANTRRVRWPITASKEALTKEEILLCHEFDQAWDHYRQNENLRSQYLGYFFVLAVGSAAFGAQTVRSPTLSSPLAWFSSVSSCLHSRFSLGLYTWASV